MGYENRFGKVKIGKQLFLMIIIAYSLFAMNRIKYAIPISVDGTTINNMVVIIMLMALFAALFLGIKFHKPSIGGLLIISLLGSVLVAAFNNASLGEGLYAFSQLVIPFCGYVLASKLENYEIESLLKFIIIVSGVYAILSLYIAANYNQFSALLGVSEITSYSRFARINMPIGSSITVSYFFNITTPFCAIGISRYKNYRLMRLMSFISLLASMTCIVLLNSRAAIISLVFVSFAFFKYSVIVKKKSINFFLYLVVGGIVIYYYSIYGEIDRFINRTSSVIASDLTRFEQVVNAFHIFLNYPIMGTGIGAVYNRTISGVIYFGGTSILSDPHNAYLMLLSEVGMIGIIFIILFVFSLLQRTNFYDHTNASFFLRNALLISILVQSLFGSHIVNEPAYSVIFWILLGLTVAIDRANEDKQPDRNNVSEIRCDVGNTR